jgi:hypothetical protein
MSAGVVQIMPAKPTDKATSTEGSRKLGKLGQKYVWLGANSANSYYRGSRFKLVKNNDGAALTQYQAVAWVDETPGTSTVTGTTAAGRANTAGIAMSAIAASGFGYVCTGGDVVRAVSAATPAADAFIAVDATDGRFDTATEGTTNPMGRAIAAGTANAEFNIELYDL